MLLRKHRAAACCRYTKISPESKNPDPLDLDSAICFRPQEKWHREYLIRRECVTLQDAIGLERCAGMLAGRARYFHTQHRGTSEPSFSFPPPGYLHGVLDNVRRMRPLAAWHFAP